MDFIERHGLWLMLVVVALLFGAIIWVSASSSDEHPAVRSGTYPSSTVGPVVQQPDNSWLWFHVGQSIGRSSQPSTIVHEYHPAPVTAPAQHGFVAPTVASKPAAPRVTYSAPTRSYSAPPAARSFSSGSRVSFSRGK